MSFDVAVVGSGPAGMSAAMRLSGSGMRTVVIERLSDAMFPRYHSVCGEAVSEKMFERIGWRPSKVSAEAESIRISLPDGRGVDIPVSGVIVDRPSMLAEMRSQCDAEFVIGTVVRIEEDGGYVLTLSDGTEIRSTWLIGADGAHSAVRREVFGEGIVDRIQVVNCVAEGDGGTVLEFAVGSGYGGGYGWRFPSAPGKVSIGFPKGWADPRTMDVGSWGARDLPFGVVDEVVKGRCILAGDAACLANPLCYGGIGIAMLSGRHAADAVMKNDPKGYARWISRDRMFDRRFMDAHRMFSQWTDDEMADAMSPLMNHYSIPRGFYAILRRPRWARVYFAVFLAFRIGWRTGASIQLLADTMYYIVTDTNNNSWPLNTTRMAACCA